MKDAKLPNWKTSPLSRSIFWSSAQNWGGRAITFFIFVIMARLLSPTDFGAVASALIAVSFVTLVSEFGFGDAIIQRRSLASDDMNLPLAVATVNSILLSACMIVYADEIEQYIGLPGFSHIATSLSALAPIMVLSSFQEVNYRRQLKFRMLAIRVLIANGIGGAAAIVAASFGAALWSLVIQSYVTALVGLVWLWSRPLWWPNWRFSLTTFKPLVGFALPIVLLRTLDFFASRVLDIIIIKNFGVMDFGLYTVGARLNQLLLTLLQGVVNDVSLPMLAKVAHDRELIARIYVDSISTMSFLAMPIFVLLASLSQELCDVVFGPNWAGIDSIAMPLFLLGAIQCVQYLNGPYLSAIGRPSKTLFVGTIKHLLTITGLFALTFNKIDYLIIYYAALQALVAPVSFGVVIHELGLSYVRIVRTLLAPIISSTIAFCCVVIARPHLEPILQHSLLSGLGLGVVFCVGLISCYTLFARERAWLILNLIKMHLKKVENDVI